MPINRNVLTRTGLAVVLGALVACSSGGTTDGAGTGATSGQGGAGGAAGATSNGGDGGNAGAGDDAGGAGGSSAGDGATDGSSNGGSANAGSGGSSGSTAEAGTGDDGGEDAGDDGRGAAPTDDAGVLGASEPDPTQDSASQPGPYMVSRYSTGVPDSPSYAGYDVDYPADAPPPLPGVAIIPGFIEGRSAVGDWGPFLASHGFAVITVDPNSDIDQPEVRATALWAAIGSLQGENMRSDSPLSGKLITTRVAVMGHSMGGGAVLETANAHSDGLRAAIALAPWDMTTAFGGITTPVLIVAGQNDMTAPVAQNAMPFYNAIPMTTIKAYAEFAGGDHQVADSPVTNTTAGLLGLSWLKVYVAGDSRYAQFIKTQSGLSSYLSSP